jgi:hypothetical protein
MRFQHIIGKSYLFIRFLLLQQRTILVTEFESYSFISLIQFVSFGLHISWPGVMPKEEAISSSTWELVQMMALLEASEGLQLSGITGVTSHSNVYP